MKRIFLIMGAALFTVLFLFSGVMISRHYAEEKESKEAFESIAGLVNEETTGQTVPDESTGATTEEPDTPAEPTPYDTKKQEQVY